MLFILFITCTLTLFRGAWAAEARADISSLDLSAIPQCGLVCIIQQVSLTPSGLQNVASVCTNTTLADDIGTCIKTNCSIRDALNSRIHSWCLSQLEADLYIRQESTKFAYDACGVPHKDRSLLVWVVPLVVFILCTTCFFLRIISRVCVSKGLDLGDVIMGVCWLFTIPFLWSAFELAQRGLGKDMWNIPADNITSILQLYWWDELLYLAIPPLTRISILLFYLKLFPRRGMKLANYVLIAINVAYMVAFELATIFQCLPIDGAWKFWDGTYDTKCNHVHAQSWSAAAINIIIDIAVILLPLPELAKLAISPRKKVQILIMFSLGFFITVVSIIRLQSLVKFANSSDVTYDYVEPGLYSIVEAEVGIICGCLPAIRALLGKMMPKLFPVTKADMSLKYRNDMNHTGSANPSSRLRFSRLESSHTCLTDVESSTINVKTEWSVQKLPSRTPSTVELMTLEGTSDCTVEARYSEKRRSGMGDGIPGQAI